MATRESLVPATVGWGAVLRGLRVVIGDSDGCGGGVARKISSFNTYVPAPIRGSNGQQGDKLEVWPVCSVHNTSTASNEPILAQKIYPRPHNASRTRLGHTFADRKLVFGPFRVRDDIVRLNNGERRACHSVTPKSRSGGAWMPRGRRR